MRWASVSGVAAPISIAPRAIRLTVSGPSVVVCMRSRLPVRHLTQGRAAAREHAESEFARRRWWRSDPAALGRAQASTKIRSPIRIQLKMLRASGIGTRRQPWLALNGGTDG